MSRYTAAPGPVCVECLFLRTVTPGSSLTGLIPICARAPRACPPARRRPSPAHHPRSLSPRPPAGAGSDVLGKLMDVTAVLTLSASARHRPLGFDVAERHSFASPSPPSSPLLPA